MKISVGAVLALVAASASGFSITMSSYLDNLASGSTLSSFSQGGSATAVAPAPSYAAPSAPAPSAPAPAPYQSSFADLPASSSNNYISTIAGGSQMKSGPNYQGMSRSFAASSSVVSNSVYLENLKGASANGASAPANGSFAPAPAPAFAAPAAPAPAPYQGSAAVAGTASPISGYIGSIGGGSQMKAGPNFTGMSGKFKPTRSIGNSAYLDGVSNGATAPANGASAPAPAYAAPSAPAPAPYQGASSVAGTSSAISGYIGTIGGGSQMKPGPNYTGMSSSFKPSRSISNSVYLDSVSSANLSSFANGAAANGHSAPAPAPQTYSSPAPAPAQAAASTQKPYVKPSSYMPQPSGRVANTGIGNYLDALK